jgi:hypothetical protein
MPESWMEAAADKVAHTAGRTCAHCHQPLVVEALAPRWRGYCARCAGRLAGHPHIESA